MLSSLIEGVLVTLRDPYAMLKSFLTHTRHEFETRGYPAIWDSYLPVLVPAAIWLFIEVALWMRRR